MSTIRGDRGHPLFQGDHPRNPDGVASSRTLGGSLSIIIPAKDEAENLPTLIEETVRVFRRLVGRMGGRHPLDAFEILVVDDGSTDGTRAVLRSLAETYAEVRPIVLAENVGQSAATIAGFRLACGDWVGVLDADLQNPPADLARLWDALHGYDAALGWRVNRADRWSRRLTSRVANLARNAVLGQSVRDTGCSVRIFPREIALRLPAFRGVHRFLGPLLLREGCRVIQVPVGHRPRGFGKSHYHWGNRSIRVVEDLIGVAWLLRRPVHYRIESMSKPPEAPELAARILERGRVR
jgi:dolichol-phosphate mannosyltransferase